MNTSDKDQKFSTYHASPSAAAATVTALIYASWIVLAAYFAPTGTLDDWRKWTQFAVTVLIAALGYGGILASCKEFRAAAHVSRGSK